MKMGKMIAIAILVWGDAVFASLPSNPIVTGGDLQVRISGLMEHFSNKHPELNVQVRDKYANYQFDDSVAARVFSELTALDVVTEQNQPEPAQGTLKTLTCSRALCFKEGDAQNFILNPQDTHMACSRPACLGGI